MNQDINQLIMEKAKEYESYVIQQRRHFHTYAEVTAKEFETSKYLKEEAAKLGLPIQELKGTGFIATLDTGRPGKTLAIRSDIDALPMDCLLYTSGYHFNRRSDKQTAGLKGKAGRKTGTAETGR